MVYVKEYALSLKNVSSSVFQGSVLDLFFLFLLTMYLGVVVTIDDVVRSSSIVNMMMIFEFIADLSLTPIVK